MCTWTRHSEPLLTTVKQHTSQLLDHAHDHHWKPIDVESMSPSTRRRPRHFGSWVSWTTSYGLWWMLALVVSTRPPAQYWSVDGTGCPALVEDSQLLHMWELSKDCSGLWLYPTTLKLVILIRDQGTSMYLVASDHPLVSAMTTRTLPIVWLCNVAIDWVKYRDWDTAATMTGFVMVFSIKSFSEKGITVCGKPGNLYSPLHLRFLLDQVTVPKIW